MPRRRDRRALLVGRRLAIRLGARRGQPVDGALAEPRRTRPPSTSSPWNSGVCLRSGPNTSTTDRTKSRLDTVPTPGGRGAAAPLRVKSPWPFDSHATSVALQALKRTSRRTPALRGTATGGVSDVAAPPSSRHLPDRARRRSAPPRLDRRDRPSASRSGERARRGRLARSALRSGASARGWRSPSGSCRRTRSGSRPRG